MELPKTVWVLSFCEKGDCFDFGEFMFSLDVRKIIKYMENEEPPSYVDSWVLFEANLDQPNPISAVNWTSGTFSKKLGVSYLKKLLKEKNEVQ